eukprot:CAMPEP_0184537084 /NCGR_PEP_ID=MMETSP0198_2-20121128/16820_1 /TAXON_ID=1112570 /ORGANISM="Thraustochytrium sp., Strain LLF1b" /LENGTH=60 /DNA_ID=CAMNT_0026930341 /DNA_START=36 /DNA_END=214 /DNA_ORIENTATION=+
MYGIHKCIDFPAFAQFSNDFDFIPSLYGRNELRRLFHAVLQDASEAADIERASLNYILWV